MSGPLAGFRVVELAGLGPAPFCGMVLADLGAEVTRIDRQGAVTDWLLSSHEHDVQNRGKRSIVVDLKSPDGLAVALDLVGSADALIEGFRPGVTERLGIGPADCLARNPRLVYGRMTGWGQSGPNSGLAGHDIDYIALSGALHAIGTEDRPIPPLNLVGDFGGGGMMLAVGLLAATLAARTTGEGQVVDASMVDGSALLMASHHGLMADGSWSARRSSNLLDGGAPFYATYRTSDGKHVAVGALEPQFYAELLEVLGLDPDRLPAQLDRSGWPEIRRALSEKFAQGTRDDWERAFAGSDACVAPVLAMDEAAGHPHNRARATFIEVAGVVQPAPAPRFSSTATDIPTAPVTPGRDTDSILAGLGYSPEEVGKLRESRAVA